MQGHMNGRAGAGAGGSGVGRRELRYKYFEQEVVRTQSATATLQRPESASGLRQLTPQQERKRQRMLAPTPFMQKYLDEAAANEDAAATSPKNKHTATARRRPQSAAPRQRLAVKKPPPPPSGEREKNQPNA